MRTSVVHNQALGSPDRITGESQRLGPGTAKTPAFRKQYVGAGAIRLSGVSFICIEYMKNPEATV